MPNLEKTQTRSFQARAKTFDEETCSVEVIAASENPVQVIDWDNFEYVDQILIMDGCVLPKNRQVPFQDTHNRWSVKATLGSARDWEKTEEKGVKAYKSRVYFASDKESQDIANKYRDGHLTDVSVGFYASEEIKLKQGETKKIKGREFEGPCIVVPKWELFELSATPIGADSTAKARSKEFTSQENKTNDFLNTSKGERKMPEPIKQGDAKTQERQKESITPKKEKIDQGKREQELLQQAVKQERERAIQIRSNVKIAGLPDEVADELISSERSVEEAGQEIFKRMAEETKPLATHSIEMGDDAKDKFRSAVLDSLLLRSGVQVEKPAIGYEDFRGRTLLRLAEDCLEKAGVSTKGMDKRQIALNALGLGTRSHSTSDFPIILSEVANKRLLKSYQKAPSTWQLWCNTNNVSDFKMIRGISISAMETLDLKNEGGEYENLTFAEGQEPYFVKTYGKIFTLTREMIINDDLGIFLKIPKLFGSASKRTINQAVYSLLSSNPKMNDGKNVFAASRNNIGTAGKPSHTTLSEARKLMRRFKDISGEAILNLAPKFVLAGSKYETDVDIILRSTAIPENYQSSGVANIWNNSLTPIIDATLDTFDENAWYILPDKTVTDTIEVSFLDGMEEPYIESKEDFNTDGIQYKCRMDFGAGILSGEMVKNAGA